VSREVPESAPMAVEWNQPHIGRPAVTVGPPSAHTATGLVWWLELAVGI